MLDRYSDTEAAVPAYAWYGRALHAWGDTDAALNIRANLAGKYPESTELKRLDRWLSKPPGTQPDEKIFIRPYRIRGLDQMAGAF